MKQWTVIIGIDAPEEYDETLIHSLINDWFQSLAEELSVNSYPSIKEDDETTT